MKNKIIKSIFIFLTFVYTILGILSFAHMHHQSVADTVSLFLGAISCFITFFSLQLTDKAKANTKVNSFGLIKILYIITFLSFSITAVVSYLFYESFTATVNLVLCAFTQLIAYIVFFKQDKTDTK